MTVSLAGRRVLVTGGAGFIGSHVVSALVDLGAIVTVADLRPYRDDTARSIVGDLTHDGAVDAALEGGTDAIVHLAAITSVLGSLKEPVLTYDTNVGITAALLERVRHSGVDSFVFASTNAVVGAGAGGAPGARIDESTPLRPLTPYGATKAAAEMLLSASAAYGVRGVALRLTNVYGTGMAQKDSVVARIMRAVINGATFEVFGDGRQVRDYVFVTDVVEAVILGLTGDISGPLVIGSGTSTSVLELLDLSRAVTGAPLPARLGPPQPGEMAGVAVNLARATSLGWQPTIDLVGGLERVWEAWGRADSGADGVAGIGRGDSPPVTV